MDEVMIVMMMMMMMEERLNCWKGTLKEKKKRSQWRHSQLSKSSTISCRINSYYYTPGGKEKKGIGDGSQKKAIVPASS